MKIIKILSKKVEDVKYYKYVLNVPKKVVEESELLGKDLSVEVKNGKIILKGK